MLTTSFSDFRKDLKKLSGQSNRKFRNLDHKPGKDSGVVIMSLEEYNSLNETQYELSSKSNEKRLDAAIENLKTGISFSKELIEE